MYCAILSPLLIMMCVWINLMAVKNIECVQYPLYIDVMEPGKVCLFSTTININIIITPLLLVLRMCRSISG